MTDEKSRSRPPVLHILMGLSGWMFLIVVQSWAVVILAIILSLLAVPRLVRGSQEEAKERITQAMGEPVVASKRVQDKVTSTEKLLLETRPHSIRLLGWNCAAVLWSAASVTVGIYLNWQAGLIMWGAGIVFFLLRVWEWRNDLFCVTTQRVFVVRGIFKIRSEYMPLNKMATARLDVPWHSSILAWLRIVEAPYGAIIVDSAAEEHELRYVGFVRNVYLVIRLINDAAASGI